MKWKKRVRKDAETHLADAKIKEKRADEQLDRAHEIAERSNRIHTETAKRVRENHFTELWQELLNGR